METSCGRRRGWAHAQAPPRRRQTLLRGRLGRPSSPPRFRSGARGPGMSGAPDAFQMCAWFPSPTWPCSSGEVGEEESQGLPLPYQIATLRIWVGVPSPSVSLPRPGRKNRIEMGSLRQRRSSPHLRLFPGLPPPPLPQQSGVVGTRPIQATPTPSTRPSEPCAGPRPLETPKPHPWTHLCRPLLRHCPLWKARSEYLCLPACPCLGVCVSVPVSDPTLLSVCLSCTFPSLCCLCLQSSACPCL